MSVIAGRIVSVLVVLFLLFDAVAKVLRLAPVVEGTAKFGYSADVVLPLGLVLLVSTVLYAIPRTCVLGAILLTGYLGGAIATHVRVGGSEFLFAAGFGVLVWVGLYLRDARLRALIPVRRD